MREKDLISLGDEIAVIDDYFFIQQKRFGCALIVDKRLTAEEKSKYSIPPLTLQLLVENAIKHNVVSREYPLTVELFIEDGQLVVRNNRKEKTTKEKSEGMGLQNIRNRFSLIADKDITVESTELFFTVKLPLIKHA
jgi:LytS/YehU family sensor histidine kinase